MTRASSARLDPDAQAMRRASRSVGGQITAAFGILVLVVLSAAFAYVFTHIKPSHVFDPGRHESTIDVDGLDILVAAVVIGVTAIALAAVLSWFATRRAVRPLGEALRLQRRFVANASHELRTPLAVLDARLQLLQRGLADTDPSAPRVAELRRDATTLVQIVNDLLETAEELGGPASATAPVLLDPILELACDSLRILAEERGIGLELDTPEGVSVWVPSASIHRCIMALLDNALRFSPSGSTIRVEVRTDRARAEIRVIDRGTGISGIEPIRVFDRFSRGDEEAGTNGFGIGLALVKDTVERYGGSAAVESTGPTGTTVLLRLPRVRRN
jgi:two-component system OmpR family sensor kinase